LQIPLSPELAGSDHKSYLYHSAALNTKSLFCPCYSKEKGAVPLLTVFSKRRQWTRSGHSRGAFALSTHQQGATNMSTPSQIAANQANAQLSTGPRTEPGKAASSLNALKTGLTGRTILLPSDDVDAYTKHLERLHGESCSPNLAPSKLSSRPSPTLNGVSFASPPSNPAF
jgi:hypothetical protein